MMALAASSPIRSISLKLHLYQTLQSHRRKLSVQLVIDRAIKSSHQKSITLETARICRFDRDFDAATNLKSSRMAHH